MAKQQVVGEPELTPARSRGRAWAPWLIAVLFSTVGLIATAVIVHELWTWTSMKRWTATPATVLAVNLAAKHHKGRTTQKTTARYEYHVGGRRYEGTRVALYTGSDNIGSYQSKKYLELRSLQGKPNAATCYVNPGNPSEVTLFRDLRPGFLAFKFIFAVPFTAVGALFFRTAWRGTKSSR